MILENKMEITEKNTTEKCQYLRKIYNEAQEKFIKTGEIDNDKYVECIQLSGDLIKYFETLHIFQIHRNKTDIKITYYINAELLVRTVGLTSIKAQLTDVQRGTLITAINHSKKVLSLEPFHKMAMELYKMTMIYLTLHNPDPNENINLLKQVLMIDPVDYQLHYNLGFVYHRANELESSLQHYKTALGIVNLLLDTKGDLSDDSRKSLLQFKVKILNGLGTIYFGVQDRE
jgi:tetratricopeptide (TPR) repeat protein